MCNIEKRIIYTTITFMLILIFFFVWYYNYTTHYFDINDYKEITYIVESDFNGLTDSFVNRYIAENDDIYDWIIAVKKINGNIDWRHLHAGDEIIILSCK